MKPLPVSRGVPYLPDNYAIPDDARDFTHPLLRIALFVAAFLLLETFWGVARGSSTERLLIDTLTVKPAVALINVIDASARAVASGMRILSPSGNLNIRNGCDGSEVLFLLAAAFLIAPMRWRSRLIGFSLGMILVFALNQLRIAVLFYAIRSNRLLFDILHTTAAPLVLIGATAIFFYGWIHAENSRSSAPSA